MGWRVVTVVATGRVKVKVAQWPSRLSTETWPPEQFDQATDQSEAEAGALVVAVGVKAAEDVGQPIRFDAAAGVPHEELHRFLAAPSPVAGWFRSPECSGWHCSSGCP